MDGMEEVELPMVDITRNAATYQSHVDVTAMIRSLQRTEGVTDCFRRGLTDCDLPDCAWRKYCLRNHDEQSLNNDT